MHDRIEKLSDTRVVKIAKESVSDLIRYDAYIQITSGSVRIWALDPKNSSFARTRYCDIELCIDEFLSPGVLSGHRPITPNVLCHFGANNGNWLRGNIPYLVSPIADTDIALKPFYEQAVSTDRYGKTQFERKPFLSLLALYLPLSLIDDLTRTHSKYVQALLDCMASLETETARVLMIEAELAMRGARVAQHSDQTQSFPRLDRACNLSGQNHSLDTTEITESANNIPNNLKEEI